MIDWNTMLKIRDSKQDVYRPRSEFMLVLRDILRVTTTAEKAGYDVSDDVVEEACQKILVLHGWIVVDYMNALENYNKSVINVATENNTSITKN